MEASGGNFKLVLALLLLASSSFSRILGQPEVKAPPIWAVPDLSSPEGAVTAEALRILAPCQVRIVSYGKSSDTPETDESDFGDTDMIHSVATLYSEMGVAYSVLRLKFDWTYNKKIDDLCLEILPEETPLPQDCPQYLRRYWLKTRRADKLDRCSALLAVTDTGKFRNENEALGFDGDLFMNTGIMWQVYDVSAAVLLIDSPRDGAAPLMSFHDLGHWYNQSRIFAFTFCSLQNWESLLCIRPLNLNLKTDQIGLISGSIQAKRGDFEGGTVMIYGFDSADVYQDVLTTSLPHVCRDLNVSMTSFEDWTRNFLSSTSVSTNIIGVLITDMESGYPYTSVISKNMFRYAMPASQTNPQASYILVADPESRKLSALIEPMDLGTWLGTLLSVGAITILSMYFIRTAELGETVFAFAMNLLGQADVPRAEKWQLRTVLSLWLLATIVIVGGYTGFLFSALTTPKVPWIPTSIQELNDDFKGDVISNAAWKWGIINAASVVEEAYQTNSPADMKKDLLHSSMDGVSLFNSFFLQRVDKASHDELKRLEKQGWTKFFDKLLYVRNDLTDFLGAHLDQSKWLSRVPWSPMFVTKEMPYKLPDSFVYVHRKAELRLYQVLLKTIGLQKIVRKGDPQVLSLFNTMRFWSGSKTAANFAINSKLQNFAEAGFVSMWTANASSYDVIEQLKRLRAAVKLRTGKTAPPEPSFLAQAAFGIMNQLFDDGSDSGTNSKDKGIDRKWEMTPMLSNFIAKRNLMVHLFNDFQSLTCVDLKTIDWSVGPLSFKVLIHVMQFCFWLMTASFAVLFIEFLVVSISFVNE